MKLKNKVITFEGIDGCGKTTQINLLSDFLDSKNKKNIIVREPGGTKISENIRKVLLDNDNFIESNTETLLFLSSRSQLVNEVIVNAISNDEFILFDRFIDSTIAYQGYGRGMNIELLKKLNDFATNMLKPDLTFVLDINLEESLKRVKKNNMDRMEKSGSVFLDKVLTGYRHIVKENTVRYRLIDCNNKKPHNIHDEIKTHIIEFYKGNFS